MRLQSVKVSSPRDQLQKSVRIIGAAIRDGSAHLPIRNWAAAAAAQAGPKDYGGQVKSLFDKFVQSWRYVKDPVGRELLVADPDSLYKLVLGGGRRGRGFGDCDEAAAALGAALASIGFPVRLAITAPPGALSGNTFSHVFIQASVPGLGWVSVDPVPWPAHGVGYTPPHSRIAIWDLDGRLIEKAGNVAGPLGFENEKNNEVIEMQNENWQDVGFAGLGIDNQEPLDWRRYVLKDFGIYSDRMPLIDGLGLAAEVETYIDPRGFEAARSPMIELSPEDIRYVSRYRRAYHGMMCLGDDGQVYTYDGFSGFFKRLFKKARGFVKKIGAGIKKVIKKIPGGKYLVKLGEKIHKVALKFVRPLIKFVGKYASKLAPVAALIPGYGPAIAAGLMTAGKVARLMQEFDVSTVGEKGKPRNLKFKSKKAAKEFEHALKKEAEKEKKRQKEIKRQKAAKKAVVRSRKRQTRRFILPQAAAVAVR